MKKLLFLLFVLLAFQFSSCDTSEQPVTTTTLLSVTIDPLYTPEIGISNYENWILVHDEKGNVLGYKQFQNNDAFVIQTTKAVTGRTLGITTLSLYHRQNQDNLFRITSFLNVEVGKSVALSSRSPEFKLVQGAPIGTFSFILNNYNSARYVMTDKFSSNGGKTSIDQNDKLTITYNLYENSNEYFFQTTDVTGNLKYMLLKNIQPGDTYNVDYSDLSDFDNVVEFSFPQAADGLFLAFGHDPGIVTTFGYQLDFWRIATPQTSHKIGYPKELTNYSTQISLEYPGYSLLYYSYGIIPDGNIEWPSKDDYSVTNNSLAHFSSEVPSSFQYRLSRWYNFSEETKTTASWDVYSAEKDHTIGNIPDEILNRYPTLNVDLFKYIETSFFSGSRSYASVVGSYLEGAETSKTFTQGISLK